MPTVETAADARLQIMSIIDIPLYLFDVETIAIVWANDAAIDYWEADTLAELRQRDMASNITSTVKLRLSQIKHACFDADRTVIERWTVYPKNIPKSSPFLISGFQAVGGQQLLLMQVKDVNATTEDEIAYRTTALMHTSTMISAFDKDLRLVYCNAAARDSIPGSVTTAKKRFVHGEDLVTIVNTLQDCDKCDVEIEINTSNGRRWHAVQVQRCLNPTNGRTLYLCSEMDITEERKAKQEAYRLAFTDSLTGLPNRAAMDNYLDDVMSGEPPVRFAILFLDLDRFKVINDSLGHSVGDQLLVDVADRLRQALGNEGMVSRLGGDEFVMLTTRSISYEKLKRIAEQILYAMATPVMVSGHKLRVLPSIGISIYPEDGLRASSIMENADAAMYIAKANQCGFCFYDAKMSSSINENIKDRMGLENDMAGAIGNNEFELYFQPKVACRGRAVTGVEALIRWHHPDRGMVSPDKFIGIAEETGQIIDLGNWVLLAAMRQQRNWQDQGLAVPISVNISARQFNANDLLAFISSSLEKTGCDPTMIELEITESMLIGEPDTVYATLQQLSAMGMRLALDDFGTGYSNLAYLQNYPLDCLKIDKVFMADRKRSMLTRTILNMGKVLGLEVIAEGVETANQADWLTAHGCDTMQGFFFSKPQPVEKITRYLMDNGAPGCDINDEAA